MKTITIKATRQAPTMINRDVLVPAMEYGQVGR